MGYMGSALILVLSLLTDQALRNTLSPACTSVRNGQTYPTAATDSRYPTFLSPYLIIHSLVLFTTQDIYSLP
jgi:uncharacterized membrane protein